MARPRNLTWGPHERGAALIPVAEHPSNTDPTATLLSGPIYKGRDIYRVKGGYLALIDGMAFNTLFLSPEDASAAQDVHLAATPRHQRKRRG